ncbi:MAG: hypothetical protein WA624_07760 [Methylocella sp.]
MTQREYTWLDDLPVAVVDAGATLPVIYCVHTDHLFRAVAMTDAGQNIAWGATRRWGAICRRIRSSSMMAPLPSKACLLF